jgi:hypothetical protein
MSQAAEQSIVLRFPTERQLPVRQGKRPETLPANVERIRPAIPVPEPLARSPELAIVLAVIAALPAATQRRIGMKLPAHCWDKPGDENLLRAFLYVGRPLLNG